jgi:hypothetical protein
MFSEVVVVNGDTLTIPELKRFNGRIVEVTLKELDEDREPGKNLKKHFGILKRVEEPMEFQKRMRTEWDEREKSF